jgi:DNA adenine methylase
MPVERPILRYHGGKWRLAEWIISHMPPHRVYVEPFGGGASVLLRKGRTYAEVYNDRWDTVVNVFKVLRDREQACSLARLLELTPYARSEFLDTYKDGSRDPVEQARNTILRSFAGFGSAATSREHMTGFRGSSNRSGTTPAHDWRNYPGNIPAFVERLQGVVIENLDAAEVIVRHDSPESLFYVDPPYPHVTRNYRRRNAAYAFEMTDADHERLAGVLHGVAGMVLLSSYHNDLYDGLYDDWKAVECNAHADGAQDRVEVLWMNEACATQQRQHRLIA